MPAAQAWATRAAACALLGSGDDCGSYVALKSFLDAQDAARLSSAKC